MFSYQPTTLVELDEAVRARIRAQERMERQSRALIRDAMGRIARAQRPRAEVALPGSTPDRQRPQTAAPR